jgi:flagellar basal body-associated protein FliL
MANYLLLRDNKQHGPYTFDEIKAKGLKAYDLVWVEGKSAAWRYPGEVEELKPFSPAVVEQPYDRFFKKPSQENKSAVQEKQTAVPEKEKALPAYQQSYLQPAKSNIYVTLPAAKNGSVIKEFFTEEKPEKKEPFIKEAAVQDFIKPTTYQASSIIEKESGSLPKEQLNINKQYTKKTPQLKKAVAADGVKKILLIAVAVILLLGGGIFIGLSINKTSSSQQSKNNNTLAGQQAAGNQTNAIPVSATVTDQKQTDNNNLIQDKAGNNLAAITQQPVDKKPAGNTEKKKPVASKEIMETAQQKTPTVIASSDTNANIIGTAHREATHRTDAAPDKETIKNTLVNMVSVSFNKYNVGTFGGISDLQLTVSNQSVHPLDLVVVEVQYLQANKKVFKTENIYFHNIGAREAMMMEAPKSPRGVKIQSKITVINTKEAGLSYTGS